MKKFVILSFVATALIFSSCGSKKKTVQSTQKQVEIELPFSGSKYQSDKSFFRAVQSGVSPNITMAQKMALHNAKSRIASNISAAMKGVTENYAKQLGVDDRQKYEEIFQGRTVEVVNQTLEGVNIMEEKIFQAPDGKYTVWVAIEMNKDAVNSQKVADKISKDERIQAEFDRAQFLKIYEDEMAKVE